MALIPAASTVAATVTDNDTGHVDAAGTVSQTFNLNVTDLSVPIQVSLSWTTTGANLNAFLMAPGSSTPIAQTSTSGTQPKSFTGGPYTPTVAGTYKLRVKAVSGASDFTASITYGSGGGGGGGIASYSKTYGFDDTKSICPYGMAYDPTDHTVIARDYWIS